ncbi:unnamed protein product [Adineta ricciae]|uniref:Uncharacterized protein n=1 Tax=Adineta ricciae TaxID=249248 RepID=A0A815VC27_ADIRI|nr:unnamed protein product [Adineta ricciae]
MLVTYNLTVPVVFLLTLIYGMSALSFDQPNLCPTAKWNQDASPFADVYDVGTERVLMFIDANNTIYATSDKKAQIIVCLIDDSQYAAWSNEANLRSPPALH